MASRPGPARWTGGKRSVQAGGPTNAEKAAQAEPEATDAAKALAAEHGVDLSGIEGTGADGKIVVGDVEAAVSE